MTTDIAGLVDKARTHNRVQVCWRRRLTGKPLEFIEAVEEELARGASFTGTGVYYGLRDLGFAVEKSRVLDHMKERCDCER